MDLAQESEDGILERQEAAITKPRTNLSVLPLTAHLQPAGN
jgi:hypothetical protein